VAGASSAISDAVQAQVSRERQRNMREVENTRTIHMWAIAVSFDSDVGCVWNVLAACTSLALVTAQIAALTWVNYDASAPPCAAHTQCRMGEFCHVPNLFERHSESWKRPRCSDCASILSDASVNTSFCETVLGSKAFGDTVLWPWSNHLMPWDGADEMVALLTDLNGEFVTTNPTGRDNSLRCLAAHHCHGNDRWLAACDHIKISLSNMEPSQTLLLVFCAALLAVPLVSDMEQATVEDIVLDTMVKRQRGRGRVPGSAFAHPMLYMSLRLRRFVVPCVAVGTAASLLVSAPITSGSIILDLIAVSFILDTDDAIALLMLRPSAIRRGDELAHKVGKAHVPFIAQRATAVAAAAMLVVLVLKLELLIDGLLSLNVGILVNQPCRMISAAVWLPCWLLSLICTCVHVFVSELSGRSFNVFSRQVVVNSALELCVDLSGVAFGAGVSMLSIYLVSPSSDWANFSIICFGMAVFLAVVFGSVHRLAAKDMPADSVQGSVGVVVEHIKTEVRQEAAAVKEDVADGVQSVANASNQACKKGLKASLQAVKAGGQLTRQSTKVLTTAVDKTKGLASDLTTSTS